MPALSPSAMVFGKLPSHGDFVSRGLSPAQQAQWDAWAGAAIATARAELGDDFDAVHDAVSPWHFVVGPGALGEGWRVGVLAASVDKVSRRFFLVLAIEGLDHAQALTHALMIGAGLDELLYAIFTEQLDVDVVSARLEGVIDQIDAVAAGRLGELMEPAAGGRWWSADASRAVAGLSPPDDILLAPRVASAPEQVR